MKCQQVEVVHWPNCYGFYFDDIIWNSLLAKHRVEISKLLSELWCFSEIIYILYNLYS